MSEAVQALIWDFGGVLLRTEDQEPRRLWEKRLDLEPGELHDIVFKCKASRLATVGQASTEEIWHSVGDRLNLELDQLDELRQDFWAGDILDHDLIAVTRTLREHIKTALLSNAWPDLRPYLEQDLQIDDAFDELVISAEEGKAKPDQQIYNLLLDRLEVPAENSVFVDDRVENVRGAESVGMQAILFQSRDQILEDLRRLLPTELGELFSD